MQHYLFVHFKEKPTPDGEQVYFGLSKDGYRWEMVNQGNPILWSYKGEKGVRDFTIIRAENGKFYIFATDLSLAYQLRDRYQNSWAKVAREGSHCLVMWESEDLVNWSEQKMIRLGGDDFGCHWAPDIIYDKDMDDYLLHWSSPHRSNHFGPMAIYYSRTKDFETFTEPKLLYRKEDSGVIDSAMYEEDGQYYLFVKSEHNPLGVIMLKSDVITGPFERIYAFDEEMNKLDGAVYEAPTAFKMQDGKWTLFLDFFGVQGKGQGYVPFIADRLSSGQFKRSDAEFSFPYGFKHGTVLTITEEEYNRIKQYDFDQ
ncbi:glycoside hydrolase family 43 protein [Amphibacillus sp. MSJ-3]|uniref:glycoside hydrolase family 43 protein n=1 Tax=Amphibacillus sp. MSJ-3 TaxID=2841505 RepID=UPI001C0E9232|nr:glycoside hydrolase family 43 protein [Amphibacillus sp. MSJ-3]MBU5595116.1 glycoside hydrolase family 43 protein [Amphibacillus sp. MSJ-3]